MTLAVTDIDVLPTLTTAMSTSSVEKAEAVTEVPNKLSAFDDGLLPALDEKPRFSDLLFRRRNLRARDPDSSATRRSVYDDPELAKHYWPSAKYENLHRFDPSARWTFAEEAAIVRKIDWRVALWAAVGFSAFNLDLINIQKANSDNFLSDLRLTSNDFNLGNTVFSIAFLAVQLPSQLVSKKLGPDRWVPVQLCLWSIVSLSQFWLSGKTGFLICRALIGLFQGGFVPDLLLYLSYFYTKTELPIRVAFCWMVFCTCSIVSNFLAVGILRMRGVLGQAGWRWLFLIEGALTLAIGIATFFMMPPSPTQTKVWFRPNGWFDEREETIIVSRVLRDDPAKGDMHNREGLSLNRIWKAICDYDIWPLYLIGLTSSIPTRPPQLYFTLSLRNLRFDTLMTNLLVIPSTCLAVVTMFMVTLLSEAVNDRSVVSMIGNVWALPCVVGLYCLPANPHPWAYYAVATALLSAPTDLPIKAGWCSRNSGAVASRTVNAALYTMFDQASAIISSNIYRADDAPQFKRGNRVLVGICVLNIVVVYPGAKLYYLWRNQQRAKIWDGMTSEERATYLETTKDVGNRRLDFRFAH